MKFSEWNNEQKLFKSEDMSMCTEKEFYNRYKNIGIKISLSLKS